MGFFKNLRIGIWFLFNRHKVVEYLDFKNTRITIYNKFAFIEDSGWHLVVMTSLGEILVHEVIEEGKLEEVKQKYQEQIKPVYADYYVGGFDIVTILPGDDYPEGYKIAADIYRANHPIED